MASHTCRAVTLAVSAGAPALEVCSSGVGKSRIKGRTFDQVVVGTEREREEGGRKGEREGRGGGRAEECVWCVCLCTYILLTL